MHHHGGDVTETVIPTGTVSTFGRIIMEYLTDTLLVEVEGAAFE